MGDSVDPIARIEDTTVRRLVRTVVHVRRFLPFYVAGTVFFVTMAAVPAIDGGGGTPASTAAPGGGAGAAAGAAATGSGASGRTGAAPALAPSTAPLLAASFSDADLDGTLDDVRSSGSLGTSPSTGAGAVGAGRGDDPLAAPDFDAPAEFPETPSAPEPCTVEPPSPAPEVEPAREVSGGQRTAEAVLGQQLPADAGETVAPVSQEAVCSVPESPVAVPSVPLPATPVADEPGLFGGLPFGGLLRSLLRF